MCYPAMLAVFTLPPFQLPRLEAVTVTVHQSAADSLFEKKNKKIKIKTHSLSLFNSLLLQQAIPALRLCGLANLFNV